MGLERVGPFSSPDSKTLIKEFPQLYFTGLTEVDRVFSGTELTPWTPVIEAREENPDPGEPGKGFYFKAFDTIYFWGIVNWVKNWDATSMGKGQFFMKLPVAANLSGFNVSADPFAFARNPIVGTGLCRTQTISTARAFIINLEIRNSLEVAFAPGRPGFSGDRYRRWLAHDFPTDLTWFPSSYISFFGTYRGEI